MSNPHHLARPVRRSALRLAIVNGALWGMGNAITTGTLVYYLAQELGASGLEIGLLLSLPAVVGIFRFAAPALIRRLHGSKPTAVTLFTASYLLLLTLPVLAWQGFPDDQRVNFLLALLAVHQLLENLATVALWTWLAELVPRRLRGRYFARRQRWQLVALIPTIVAAGLFTDFWRHRPHDALEEAALGYVLPIGVGALLLLLSIVPLVAMPAVPDKASGGPARRWADLRPLFDGRFGRLLLFGCWLSFFNGIMQTAANIYPRRVLDLGVLPLMAMATLMRLGQIGLAPWVGRLSDRYGNRPVMFVSQAVAALGPLFFLLATPNQPYWLCGAYVAWSAYVGLNVCLPNLTLKLARDNAYAAYTAAYFALTGLAYAASTLIGGWLFDFFWLDTFYFDNFRLDRYGYLFYLSLVGRLLALVVLLGVEEPGAWSWRRIINALRGQHVESAVDRAAS